MADIFKCISLKENYCILGVQLTIKLALVQWMARHWKVTSHYPSIAIPFLEAYMHDQAPRSSNLLFQEDYGSQKLTCSETFSWMKTSKSEFLERVQENIISKDFMDSSLPTTIAGHLVSPCRYKGNIATICNPYICDARPRWVRDLFTTLFNTRQVLTLTIDKARVTANRYESWTLSIYE